MSGGILLGADLLRLPTACPESASRGRVRGARNVALEHDPLALAAQVRGLDRNGREKRLRVRVHGRLVELLSSPDLHDPPEVHHRDAVGNVSDDREVVRNEDVGEPEIVLKLCDEIHDLCLNRDVERRDRLVEHDHLRVERECPRDTDSLSLSTRELVGKAVSVLGTQADGPKELLHATTALGATVELVDPKRLGDDLAHRHPRVQRRVRVLEDDLDVASDRTHLAARKRCDVLAVEDDPAGRRLEELDDGSAERRLAAAGFTDDPERLATAHREIDTVDRLYLPDGVLEQSRLDRKVLDETLDAQDVVFSGGGCLRRRFGQRLG